MFRNSRENFIKALPARLKVRVLNNGKNKENCDIFLAWERLQGTKEKLLKVRGFLSPVTQYLPGALKTPDSCKNPLFIYS
jgi:hypothetical protein